MENCGVTTLSEDQQANLSKLPCPVSRGHSTGQKAELLCRRFCKKKGLCISPKKPRPGRWHRMLQSVENELGNTFFHMYVTLTETSIQRVQLQCHPDGWDNLGWLVQHSSAWALLPFNSAVRPHGPEGGTDGREMYCTNTYSHLC